MSEVPPHVTFERYLLQHSGNATLVRRAGSEYNKRLPPSQLFLVKKEPPGPGCVSRPIIHRGCEGSEYKPFTASRPIHDEDISKLVASLLASNEKSKAKATHPKKPPPGFEELNVSMSPCKPAIEPSNGKNGPRYRISPQVLFKTEVCKNWYLRKSCRYGSRCIYDAVSLISHLRVAHGAIELNARRRVGTYKTQACPTAIRGAYCSYGIRCNYGHPGDVIRRLGPSDIYYDRDYFAQLMLDYPNETAPFGVFRYRVSL